MDLEGKPSLRDLSTDKPMSDKHRNLLRRSKPDLLKDLEPTKLLGHLTSALDDQDFAEIKSLRTRIQQAEALLDIIPRRGEKAYFWFVEAIRKHQPYLENCLTDHKREPSSLADQEVSDNRRHHLEYRISLDNDLNANHSQVTVLHCSQCKELETELKYLKKEHSQQKKEIADLRERLHAIEIVVDESKISKPVRKTQQNRKHNRKKTR